MKMLFYVKIKPNQRFDRLEKSGNDWIVRLKAPAIDGMANEHLIEYLSEILDLPKSKIIIRKGHVTRFKCLEIGAEQAYVEEKLLLASATNPN